MEFMESEGQRPLVEFWMAANNFQQSIERYRNVTERYLSHGRYGTYRTVGYRFRTVVQSYQPEFIFYRIHFQHIGVEKLDPDPTFQNVPLVFPCQIFSDVFYIDFLPKNVMLLDL